MLDFVKKYLKKVISLIPAEYWFRLSVYSIFKHKFSESLNVPTFKNRQELQDYAIKHCINTEIAVTYVEFGVWKGESIKYFASNIKDCKSIFIGLDSFEGLPEGLRC